MSGRPKASLVLTDIEREELKALTLRRKTAQALAQRARIVLACADGNDNKVAAARQRVTPQMVSKWRARFVEHRLDGLLDAPRSGAPRTIDDARVDAVIARTLESVLRGATHWSTRTMASATGLSQTAVSRIWRAFGLQPHRQETFKLSTDPMFVEKVRDIVGLYMDPPLMAMVLCVDEKSQIQALDRTQPLLPLAPLASPSGAPMTTSAMGRPRCLRPWTSPRDRSSARCTSPPQQRIPAVPANRRGQRACGVGHPPGHGQLRHAQDGFDQIMAGPAPPHSRALHADFGVVAEPSRTLVCNAHAALHSSRHASLHATARADHSRVPRHQQRQAEAFRLVEDRR
jgi:transposase